MAGKKPAFKPSQPNTPRDSRQWNLGRAGFSPKWQSRPASVLCRNSGETPLPLLPDILIRVRPPRND